MGDDAQQISAKRSGAGGTMVQDTGLPAVRTVGAMAPFHWLAGGWQDFMKVPGPCLVYGATMSFASIGFTWAFIASNAAFWVLALTCGFVFIAPMLAMGLYEAGRLLETGQKPTLSRMLFLRHAVRQDVVYLGLVLLMIYLLWGRIAQLVYGLSTYQYHRTVKAFVTFALTDPEGQTMAIANILTGGIIAFFTYAIVVVAAPMLVEPETNVFAATVTSFTVVAQNFVPMLIWAFLIVALLVSTIPTGFLSLTIIFPCLGLASWRAYRDLVVH
jgi:uncharacterized membrane protein